MKVDAQHPAGGQIRIGVLGAARIAPHAVIGPAHSLPGVCIECVAARNERRAREFAIRWAIPRWHTEYAALVDDPNLDALYIPLPNALHFGWALRALAAGKHVLCEKPLASNAAESQQLADAAARAGRILMEGFHNRYHPQVLRIGQIVRSGELGAIQNIQAIFRTPTLRRADIRFEYALGGGATMDMGCYMVNLMRYVAGDEPVVAEARARLMAPEVDRRMQATLQFAAGATGHMDVEMQARRLPDVRLIVSGDRGSLHVVNPILPQLFQRMRVRTGRGARDESFPRTASYRYQLAAFVGAIQHGAPFPTDAPDAVRNMRVIDAIYLAAGLRVRGEKCE